MQASQREEERVNRVSSWLSGRPQVTLYDLRYQLIEKNAMDEEALDAHLFHYIHRRELSLVRWHLLYLTHLHLNHAREITQGAVQFDLLFKAVDLLRMYIQYCEATLDMLASRMIVHIFSIFPYSYDYKWHLEAEICQNYFRLFKNQKKFCKKRIWQ